MLTLTSSRLEAAKVRIEELEKEKQEREPLYEIGKDIRLRFLEQARESVLFTDHAKLNLATIERGNEAAHSGNGVAVAAIISQISHTANCNKLHHSAAERRKIFISLYLLEHGTYMQTTATNRKLREAINLQATIRTIRSLNQGVDRPLKEKQSAMDAFEIIRMKYDKASAEETELNESEEKEVIRRLGVLREFTKTIVEYDRRLPERMVERRRPLALRIDAGWTSGFVGV
jgi:hypothetical protein